MARLARSEPTSRHTSSPSLDEHASPEEHLLFGIGEDESQPVHRVSITLLGRGILMATPVHLALDRRRACRGLLAAALARLVLRRT